MLATCTNPSCSARFLYLAEGKLFRLDIDPTVRSLDGKALEYFWLCGGCSAAMTLRLAQDGRVTTTGRQVSVHKASDVAFSANRESGRLLRSVTWLSSSTCKEYT